MNTLYHVARAGAEIGVFRKADILDKRQTGELPSDCYVWAPGMTAWVSIASLTAELPQQAPPSRQQTQPMQEQARVVQSHRSIASDLYRQRTADLSWNMAEALKAVAWYRYADFDGRAGRAELWYAALGVTLILLLFALVCGLLFTLLAISLDSNLPFLIPALLLAAAACYAIVPFLAVMVRRLHDIGMNGLLCLLALLPGLGVILLLIFALMPSGPTNRWGDGPEDPGPGL